MVSEPQRSRLRGARRAYTRLAVLACNTLLLLVLVNVIVWITLRVLADRDSDRLPASLTALASRFGPGWMSMVYPGWEESQLVQLWHEWNRLTFDYEPFTQFKVRPMQGRYINVSEHGFRSNGALAPWPPDPAAFNVFVFGGSTTFGTMLPDEQTLPAALQAHLQNPACEASARVYNFACPAYISTQERALFEQLLLAKAVPQVAIFVDGLNDSVWQRSDPRYTDKLASMVRAIHAEDLRLLAIRARDLLYSLPMTSAADQVLARVRSARRTMPIFPGTSADTDNFVDRWIANKRMQEVVAEPFGVRVLTVWQPSPTYRYDLQYHAFGEQLAAWGMPEQSLLELSKAFYAQIEARRHDPDVQSNFLWLGDLQLAKRENLYVDSLHYTAAFTDEIAKAIFDELRRRGWLACAPEG